MDQWAVRLRRWGSCGMGVLLCLATGGAASAEYLRFGVDQATFAWSEPQGIIDGYVVLVSRDGGPEVAELVVDEPRATLPTHDFETLVVRVRAIGRLKPTGAVLVSGPSQASETTRFVPAPKWPANGLMALSCAPCEALMLRASSTPSVPLTAQGLPAPWRLEGIGALDADAPQDTLWRNEQTGELRTADLGDDPRNPDATSAPVVMGLREFVGIARIEQSSQPVIVLRNGELGIVEFWRVSAGALRAPGAIQAPAQWRLVAAEDLDGDGYAELWWQTDRPGRMEVWRTRVTQPTELLARIVTGQPGRIVEVADFDGDGRPEPLWRDDQGRLSITFFRPGGGGDVGSLEDVFTFPATADDVDLEVRGAFDVDGLPGDEIIVQHRTSYRVSVISPSNTLRAAMFDLAERFELVQTF